MTYSIVARDPVTGRFGVAVQSHYLGVGPVVPWLAPGIGAIATQAQVDISYGPIGLELLRNGRSAEQVVAALLAGDATPEVRQVGVVDAEGRAAAYTGTGRSRRRAISSGTGSRSRATSSSGTAAGRRWPRRTRPAWPGRSVRERLLRALEAAEAEGGDVRGRQSSAIVIVDGSLQPNAWKGRILDARVDDHPDPVPELRRIVDLYEAYALLDEEGDAVAAGLSEA